MYDGACCRDFGVAASASPDAFARASESLHGARRDDSVADGAGRQDRDGDVERDGEPGVPRESFVLVAAADIGDVAERSEPDVAIGANGVRTTGGCNE